MKNWTKYLSLLLCIVMALSLMTACGQSAESTSEAASSATEAESAEVEENSEAAESGEIEIWVYGWEPRSVKLFQEDAVKYMEEHAGVTVKVTPVSAESNDQKLNATMAGGVNPDIAMTPTGVKPVVMASKGVLLSVSDLGLDDIEEKFFEGTWSANNYNGETYAIPLTANNLGVYYNKELFDNAGLEYPTADWTWEDLVENAKALTDPDAGIYGFDMGFYDPGNEWKVFTLAPFLYQCGGDFLTEDRTASAFDSETTREALQLWNQLQNVDESMPRQAPGAGINRFMSGLVAMKVTGPWNVAAYLDDPAMGDKLGVIPMPANKFEGSVIGGESLVAFKNTEHPQLVSDYLRHVTTDTEFLSQFYNAWTTIPPVKELINFYDTDEKYGPLIKVFADQMPDCHSRQFVPQQTQIENAIGVAMQDYLFEGKDLDEVLATAEEEINRVLTEE